MRAPPLLRARSVDAGLARSIEMLSLHAAVFGVGITVGAGLMLVLAVSASTIGG
jgi:hypothetical protein